MISLKQLNKEDLETYIDCLTEMNICLRLDEKMDNIMSDDEVKQRMSDFFNGNTYNIYLLLINKDIAGYALIDHTKNPMYLRQIFIKKEFRGKKYGKLLIELIMNDLKINAVDLEVMYWNDKAIKFYEEFGFIKRYIGMRYKRD